MSDVPDEPREERKPKKKRKKRRAASERLERPLLDAQGRERPRFLLSFPADPELDRLVAAFEAGDFSTVRKDAPALAEHAEDARVREAALELRRRIDPDPMIRYMWIAAVVLLLVLVFHAYFHK
jgi:hypothetical protein